MAWICKDSVPILSAFDISISPLCTISDICYECQNVMKPLLFNEFSEVYGSIQCFIDVGGRDVDFEMFSKSLLQCSVLQFLKLMASGRGRPTKNTTASSDKQPNRL